MASACALAIFSGKIIFNRAMPERLRTLRHCIFTGGGVEENGSCRAAFCESAAQRGAPLPSSPTAMPPSPRGRLFAVAGNFAAAPKGAPLGELAKPQALTEGVAHINKKETTAQKLCNGFSCYCIKQSEQDQTSSRTAISAASPRRAPILMMRV